MLKFLFILLAMVLLAVSAAWISFEDGLPDLPDDPQNRGTFVFADTTEPGNLDPGRTSALIDFRIIKCLYTPLMVYEFGGESLEYGAAVSHEISEDGRVYTFKLREEGRWSDGERVTTEDFIYAWRRAMLHETGADYAALFYLIEGAKEFKRHRQGLLNFESLKKSITNEDEYAAFIAKYPELESQAENLSAQEKLDLTFEMFENMVGIKAIDDLTLEITLENPTAYFMELCAFPSFAPVPEHVVEEYTTLDEKSGFYMTQKQYWGDPDRLICNGPYTLIDWKPKQRLVLDQNPEYWAKDEMGNLRVIQYVIPDATLALLRFRDGQIHWITSVAAPQLRAKLVESQYEHAHVVPNAGTYYYQFYCLEERVDGRPNPFEDVRMRQALSMCINRQDIVDFVTRNDEPTSVTFVPAGQIPGYIVPEGVGMTFDPQRARELMAEAGHPNGEGLSPITLLINSSGTSGGSNEQIAGVIRKVWEDELGLTINLEQPEFQVYLEESKQGNFDVRRAGWFGDYRDPTTWLDMLRSDDSNNDAKYNNPAYDALLASAAIEPDPVARLEILVEAESMLLEDAAVCPIYNYVTMMVYDNSKIEVGPNSWNNMRLDLIQIQRD